MCSSITVTGILGRLGRRPSLISCQPDPCLPPAQLQSPMRDLCLSTPFTTELPAGGSSECEAAWVSLLLPLPGNPKPLEGPSEQEAAHMAGGGHLLDKAPLTTCHCATVPQRN